jgi:DNA-directed RNA polymerase subunit RPC12/RpoP
VSDPEAAPAEPAADAVANARDKYHCPSCGAEATWNPGKQALVCPFCGTESPATLETRGAQTVIVEHDLVAALRGVPDSARGWQAARTSVRCQSCQAISVFDADKVGQRCDFCGSSALVPYEQVKDAFRPESLLPLRVAEPQARDLLRAWYGRLWFAPGGFGLKALTDTVRAVYLPYWTFDAKAEASWTAEAGRYYTVTVNNRQERRVRWTPASGSLSQAFDDELVCASRGIDAALLRAVEPFPKDALVPYDPGYLAGWVVERYQIDLVAAAQQSRRQMDEELRALCARQVPGDTSRNLVVHASYRDLTFKQILAPVWLVAYTYRGKAYQVVVNGVTGRISGRRPWSWIKVTLALLAALFAAYLFSHLR